MCDQKLIGAEYFNAAWGGKLLSRRRGRGSSCPRVTTTGTARTPASTAGGNNSVMPTGPAAAFGKISGMAPRARISAYKALWSTQDGATASGFTSDLVAAIDTAVADGVDVINYSISGTTTNFADPAEIAFLFAADAGVFVAASAGNSGPTTGTVAHPSPWITTVAAGTHNRNGTGSVTLGNGITYFGASVASAVGPRPFIDSEDALNPAYVHVPVAGVPDAATAVRLCFIGSIDPAVAAGKIVLCERGVNARVDKSQAVEMAGGHGMVLANPSARLVERRLPLRPDGAHLAHRLCSRRCICEHRRRDGDHQPVDHHDDRPGAVHGVVLVARSADGGRRRPAQAGRHCSRPGHPGGDGSDRGKRRP